MVGVYSRLCLYQHVQTRRPLVAQHPSSTETCILPPRSVVGRKAPNNLAPALRAYSVRYRNARTEPSDKSAGTDGSDVESGITGWEQVGQARWLMARTWRASQSGCDVMWPQDSRIVARTSHVVPAASRGEIATPVSIVRVTLCCCEFIIAYRMTM